MDPAYFVKIFPSWLLVSGKPHRTAPISGKPHVSGKPHGYRFLQVSQPVGHGRIFDGSRWSIIQIE